MGTRILEATLYCGNASRNSRGASRGVQPSFVDTSAKTNTVATNVPPLVNATHENHESNVSAGNVVNAQKHTQPINLNDENQLNKYRQMAKWAPQSYVEYVENPDPTAFPQAHLERMNQQRKELPQQGQKALNDNSRLAANFGPVRPEVTSGSTQVVTGVPANQVKTNNTDLNERLQDFEEEVMTLTTGQTNLSPEEKTQKLKVVLSQAKSLHDIGKSAISSEEKEEKTKFSKVTAGLQNVIQREMLLVEANLVMQGKVSGNAKPSANEGRVECLRLIGELEKSEQGVKTPGVSQDSRAKEALANLRQQETDLLIYIEKKKMENAYLSKGPQSQLGHQAYLKAARRALPNYCNRIVELANEAKSGDRSAAGKVKPSVDRLVKELEELSNMLSAERLKEVKYADLFKLKSIINELTEQKRMLGEALGAAGIDINHSPGYQKLEEALDAALKKYGEGINSGSGDNSQKKLEEKIKKATQKENKAIAEGVSQNNRAAIMGGVRNLALNIVVLQDMLKKKNENETDPPALNNAKIAFFDGMVELTKSEQEAIFKEFPALNPRNQQLASADSPASKQKFGDFSLSVMINLVAGRANNPELLESAFDNDLQSWINGLEKWVKKGGDEEQIALAKNLLITLKQEWEIPRRENGPWK